MKIKVLEKTPGCMPEIIEKGDWIDLRLAQDVSLKGPNAHKLRKWKKSDQEQDTRIREVDFPSAVLPLGICIQVPKGYECIVVPRSSTFRKWGLIQTNSMGVIDQAYCSDKDEWKLPVITTRNVIIPKGTRLAQFRVQLSQKATLWQKLRWLFSSGVKIEKTESLDNEIRGGFGSTGSN